MVPSRSKKTAGTSFGVREESLDVEEEDAEVEGAAEYEDVLEVKLKKSP
jgi:hypothetical protein